MARALFYLAILVVLAGLGIIGYALMSDLSVEAEPVSVPVELDVGA
ncbi:hypothetical protein FHS89_002221 [Rubricella aquisinus]|uniref:Uncharacterized protein n=1 Tax=Rubricella aquisinus TaxID=2028108 RepID=A0A840X2V8_9RHOB|nr:hypothetical protein [Rubricella aquisinus]MBB5516195.1 hypothetical protein [Rubricella aquisinus]